MDIFISICPHHVLLSRSHGFGLKRGFTTKVTKARRKWIDRKIRTSSSWPFFVFFFASIVHLVVHKSAQTILKLRSQNGSAVSGMRMKNHRIILLIQLKWIYF